MALYKAGVSGGAYQFGELQGVKETPSSAQGLDLGLDYMIGKLKTKGMVYQITGNIFPDENY
jgi:hypothetical protein